MASVTNINTARKGAKAGAGKGSARPAPQTANLAAPKPRPPAAPPETQTPTVAAPAQMTDAQLRSAVVKQIASLTLQHRQLDNKLESARLVVTELNDQRKLVRSAIGNKVPMPVFDTAYEQMRLKVKTADLAAVDYATGIVREAMGLVSPQPELEFARPAAVATVDWELTGYMDGIEGRPADATKAGVPGDQTQIYMTGFQRAMAFNGEGLKLLKDPAMAKAKPKAPGLPDGEGAPRPDWSMWDASHHHWTEEQKAAFLVWYEALDPEILPDVTNKAVLARMDFLDAEKDPDRAAAEEAREDEAANPDSNILTGKNPDTGDEFEASPEELAAQKHRAALAEAKAANVETPKPEVSDGAILH